MPPKLVNIAIADKHAIFRNSLKSFLSEQDNLQVCLHAPDIVDLLDKFQTIPIDVLIMDIFPPDWNGFETLKNIRSRYPEMRILLLTMHSDMDLICQFLDCGIHGFLSKVDETDELLKAIRTTAEKGIYRNRIFTEALYYRKQSNAGGKSDKTSVVLTDREKKMLQLIWEEKSNKEIAGELLLGLRSIEKLRQDIKGKVGARSMVGLLKYAIDKSIIRVNPALDLHRND
jgi:DNA-binding NarL/FixJ family response regulator